MYAPNRDGTGLIDPATDRLPTTMTLMALALVVLSIADGLLTLLLLEHHFEEVNPAMRLLLRRGPTAFVLGKYALTVFGLPVLLIFRNRSVFLPGLRVAHVLPVLVAMYVGLLIYQIDMLGQVGMMAADPRLSP